MTDHPRVDFTAVELVDADGPYFLGVAVVAGPRQNDRTPRGVTVPGESATEETEQAVIATYQAGQTMKQIAARHDIHRVTVSEVLDRTGTTKRPKGLSPSQVDIAVRLYESGLSLASVGSQLKFDAVITRTMLLRRGVKTRDSHGRER